MLAEVLLDMRGVYLPTVPHWKPMKPGSTARKVYERLKSGPQSVGELADMLEVENSELTRRASYNRAYQALLQLRENGHVEHLGKRVWALVGWSGPS